MRYMLLQAYGEVELEGCTPMTEWAPEDVRAHIDFQHALNVELLDRGELVDAQGLAGRTSQRSWYPTASTRRRSSTARTRSRKNCGRAIAWSTSKASTGGSLH